MLNRKLLCCVSFLATAVCCRSLLADELKVEQAIQLALEHNREIANSMLAVSIAGDRLAAFRTHLLPSVNLYALGAQQLRPVDFTIAKGTLGTYSGTGPLPGKDVNYSTPMRPTGIYLGRVVQPLWLGRIRLNLKMLDLAKQLAQEQTRSKRQDVARDVKQLYYSIQQIESSLRAVRETLKLYQEVERLTADYVAKQTALEADHLEAQTRVAKTEENELALSNQEATQKETLNQLLGRDVLTDFTVTEAAAEGPDFQADIAAARRQALEQRPEIRQARINLEHAQQDLKVKRSEYIPDVSAEFNTYGLVAFSSFLPAQFTSIGVSVSWEPWDWGRKKQETVEKRRAIEQTQNTELDARNKVLIEVNDKYRQVLQARSQFRVARLSQQTALENVRVMKKKFEVQSALLKDVLQAQASLEQTNADYQQSVAKYSTARAEFEHAIGEDQ